MVLLIRCRSWKIAYDLCTRCHVYHRMKDVWGCPAGPEEASCFAALAAVCLWFALLVVLCVCVCVCVCTVTDLCWPVRPAVL